MATTVIDHSVQAQVVAEDAMPFAATLRYDAADPLAVQVVFPAEVSLVGRETVWTFGRDLLAAAPAGPAGAGSVRLWPSQDRILLELQAPEGVAIVGLTTTDVHHFLTSTYAAVPVGAEATGLDLDRALAGLLRGV